VASDSPKKLSTTALAKLLQMDSKQLFELLVERKWMVREKQADGSNVNKLTTKGEFEGGEYLESKKFGTYIVWPSSLSGHSLFRHQEIKLLSVASLAKSHHLSSQRLHGILQEMGWLDQDVQGWQLTALGRQAGGIEKQDGKTGKSYVLWPSQVQDQTHFKNTLNALLGKDLSEQTDQFPCVDGHVASSKALMLVDNWLYSAGLVHAVGRALAVDDTLRCDFYLPQGRVYLEYWGFEKTPAYLKQKMAKKEAYQEHKLNVIELQAQDLDKLDQVLPKRLLQFGIQVYQP